MHQLHLDQWNKILAAQNAANASGSGGGITMAGGPNASYGTINCGGEACGSATMKNTPMQDEGGATLLMAVPLERLAGPLLDGAGSLLSKMIGRSAAKGAEEAAELFIPKWADTPGGFVNFVKSLTHKGADLTADQVDQIVAKGKQLGVDIRLDPPHPGTAWEVPHLNVGREGQVHLRVPDGYANSSIPMGSARKP